MTIPVHRDTDARICGAATTVAGNSDVFANNLLVSVNGDPNTHGGGELIAHSNQVFADNILSVNHTADTANPDAICPIPPHCGPSTDQGSPNVFTGDPSGDPIVIVPPAVIQKMELQIAVYIADPYDPSQYPDEEEIPFEEPDEVTIEEQQTEKHTPTVDTEEAVIPVQEKPEAKTHEDLCHPFDGILDQYLLEASKGEWLEKGITYHPTRITKKNRHGFKALPYFGAVNNKHVYQKPDGTADVDGEFQNQKILGIWKEIGYVNANVWYTDQTAWCMGFLNFTLKKAGYRYIQSATAKHLYTKQADYQSTEITDFTEAKCGDMCYWSSSHVNFIYSNNPDKKLMSFVGGNQGAGLLADALTENNPAGGSVTHSWAGKVSSPYNPNGREGGDGAYNYSKGTPHNTQLLRIFRPKKIA